MKQGRIREYNYSTNVANNYGTYQVSLGCYQVGGDWTIRMEAGPFGRIEMKAEDFEALITNHLRQQGYTLWSPDQQIAAWAMAHMAGYIRGEDDLLYINPFEKK